MRGSEGHRTTEVGLGGGGGGGTISPTTSLTFVTIVEVVTRLYIRSLIGYTDICFDRVTIDNIASINQLLRIAHLPTLAENKLKRKNYFLVVV